VEDALLVVRGYYHADQRELAEVFDRIFKFDPQALADRGNISVALGFLRDVVGHTDFIELRGYRMLNRIPRLPMNIIENVVQTFHPLSALYDVTIEDLQAVGGVGEIRAATIKDELMRMKFHRRSDWDHELLPPTSTA